jgi:hypothetical protein
MRSWLSLYLIIASSVCVAQNTLKKIDLTRIPQEKIRTLLTLQFSENSILQCNILQPTYHKGQNLKGYHYLESAYMLKEIPEKVWKTYQATSPAESWNGSMVSFGLLISKSKNSIMYRDDKNFTGIDTGQVFYVNLKIMKGLYNLAVGLEIIDIDTFHRSITFSYIKGGKSRGEQTIFFIPTKKGYTEIIHQTAFKGDSYIRDRYLYPYFHRIAINEFHRNMKKFILLNNKPLSQS